MRQPSHLGGDSCLFSFNLQYKSRSSLCWRRGCSSFSLLYNFIMFAFGQTHKTTQPFILHKRFYSYPPASTMKGSSVLICQRKFYPRKPAPHHKMTPPPQQTSNRSLPPPTDTPVDCAPRTSFRLPFCDYNWSGDPLNWALHNEFWCTFYASLGKLPFDYLFVLEAKSSLGLTNAQIAQSLDICPRSVNNYYDRALSQVRKILAEAEYYNG